MYFDPRAIFMLVVLVGVTGWVLKSLMVTWSGIRKGDQGRDRMADLEERMRKVEAATASVLVDVSTMREKQRFMGQLKAGSESREPAHRAENHREMTQDSGISPMVTQNIPIIPRARSPRG